MGMFNRLFSAIDAAGSGLTAERLRMDVIADNIANVNTTRTPEGGPYRRKQIVFVPRSPQPFFGLPFHRELTRERLKALRMHPDHIPFSPLQQEDIRDLPLGVRVLAIERDEESPLRIEYQPGHPDANEEGYVEMPNINIVIEMTDMITATRAYEANVTTIKSARQMMMRALQIGQ
ncbi:TPA: flagellar basal body rod protein FlgC [bacterium]|nr:flagellar basal body rod protein FlgC [bacterium]